MMKANPKIGFFVKIAVHIKLWFDILIYYVNRVKTLKELGEYIKRLYICIKLKHIKNDL